MNVLIIGAGFSGKAIGQRCADEKIAVAGTTRSEGKLETLSECGIAPILFDGVTISAPLRSALQNCKHLVVSIAPPREEAEDPSAPVDPTLIAFGGEPLTAVMPNLQWVGYLSTVGVYGNADGAWIDEEAELSPTSARSRQRVRAEREWQEAARAAGIPLAIFRLSGIYGPGRNALMSAHKGKTRRLIKPGQVFNRIHVDDIATAVTKAAHGNIGGVFNVTDHEPAPPQDVVAYAHTLMGKDLPPEQDFDTADLTPMARSFYGDNKRVSNARSRSVLNMTYQWPDYRVALDAMWRDGTWKR